MIKKENLVIAIILVLTVSLQEHLWAQNNTIYYMGVVPQAHSLNPASQPQCTFYYSVLSFETGIYNSAFSPDDIIYYDRDDDVVKHPLYSNSDREEFLKNFKDANYFQTNTTIDHISFGFRVKEMYFTMDLSSKINQRLVYPGDFISFALEGTSEGQNFDMSSLSLDFTNHLELGIGVSKSFSDILKVGIRPKILFGITTMNTTNNNFTMTTTSREVAVEADMEMNISAPGMIIPTDEDGIIDIEEDFDFDSTISSTSDYIKLATGNMGLGIDIGAHYRPIEQLEISLSLIDLGYIKWKNYTHTVKLQGTYHFEGYEQNIGDTLEFSEYILDSLKSSFQITGSDGAFVTHLSPKLFIGGRYFITPALDVGALGRLDFIESNVKFNALLLANWKPSTMLGISLSYGLFDGSPTSFGLGFSFRLGPVNLYIVSDDLPTTYNKIDGYPVPNGMRYYSLRFGLNTVIGCNQYKRLRKDKPMYYTGEY